LHDNTIRLQTMKIVGNPVYQSLNSFIQSIPSIFDKEGTLVYKARNQLKTYRVGEQEVIVKSFRKPFFLNRIVYTFFRPSKARRSYEYAFRLLEKGVSTPAPIACIEEKKGGLLSRSYYISVFEKNMDHIRSYMAGEKKDDALIRGLAEFISDFHSKGVYFLDISPGNFLQKKENGKFSFSLVDINRMKFKSPLSLKDRYNSFKRLTRNFEILESVAREYARCSQLDEQVTIAKTKEACRRFFNIKNQ